jgi:hypothetical protein
MRPDGHIESSNTVAAVMRAKDLRESRRLHERQIELIDEELRQLEDGTA